MFEMKMINPTIMTNDPKFMTSDPKIIKKKCDKNIMTIDQKSM